MFVNLINSETIDIKPNTSISNNESSELKGVIFSFLCSNSTNKLKNLYIPPNT